MSTDYFLFLRAAEMQTFFGKGLFNVHATVRQRPLAIEIVGMPLEKFQLLEHGMKKTIAIGDDDTKS